MKLKYVSSFLKAAIGFINNSYERLFFKVANEMINLEIVKSIIIASNIMLN